MLDRAKNLARRLFGHHAKAILHGNWYPLLLPHHQLVDGGFSTLGGPIKRTPPQILTALKLCDGTRTLSEISAQTGVSPQKLLKEEDADTLVLWPERPRPATQTGHAMTRGVVVSPHLDDAALSMGSAMLSAAKHTPFLVVDVFSTVSWWRFDLSEGILSRVQTTRDAEEERVIRLTNSQLRRWGLPEAPLRGYPLKEIFTTPRKPEAAGTHEMIRTRVYDLALEKPGERWFLPLGIGNHIDHRIARDAALDGLRDANVPGKSVAFYEDLPYAAQQPGVQDFSGFLQNILPEARLEILVRTKVESSKPRLLRFYYSQLTRPQIDSVAEYAGRINSRSPCERLWMLDKKSLENSGGKIPALAPLV